MSKTVDNLMAAFAGESQANRKYTAYAQQADKEGLGQVAKLFRAAAHAETIHALAHFRHAGKVGKTAENLQDAIGGETHEFTEMYPQMIKDAEAEGNAKMAKWLDQVSQVEACHASLYKKAVENDELVITATFPDLDSQAVTISASRLIDSRGETAAYQTRSISKVAGQGVMIKITIPLYEVTS